MAYTQMQPLTFAEFLETRRLVTVPEAAAAVQCEPEMFGDATGVWLYDDSFYISQIRGENGWLHMERSEYTGPRNELERILYAEGYTGWCMTDPHMKARGFMEAYSRPGWQYMSLDDWLSEYADFLPERVLRVGHGLLTEFTGYGGNA